jgi:Ser/Thr protein kinase RdoA (MazF antagonist)
MGLAERVSEALTSAGRLFRSGLQFFATGNVTVHNEPDHDPAVNYRLSDDSGNTTGHTEVVVQSTTPRSGSNSHSKDGLHTFEAHHAVGDVHGGVQSLDDASSNADSEDSWTFESPPLDLNYEALKHIGNYFTSGSHGRCTGISTLPRGQFHEIRVLYFEDGWTCIARFTREAEPLAKVESELATIEYVRNNTTIPVPEIYLVNNSENHAVGAPFVLMEHIHGSPLDDMWEVLSLDHKLDAITQVAGIHGRLAGLKFDTIGCIGTNQSVGPLLDQVEWWQPLGNHAFTKTSDYLNSYMREDNPNRTESAQALYPTIKEKISAHLERNALNPTLHAPFRLIHPDLGFQNILVTQEDGMPPKIRGVIDWDWSYIGLLYYLCEYPRRIQDWDFAPECHDDNQILRKHFVKCFANHFPKASADREAVKQSFREKNHTMNFFQDTFMNHLWDPREEFSVVESYMNDIGMGEPAYGGIEGWQPDSEAESDDEDAG